MSRPGIIPLLMLIIYLSINCLTYIGDKTYVSGEDINPSVSYIQKNIQEYEKLYVHLDRKVQVQFKIGYSTTKIGNVDTDNIIFGEKEYEWNIELLSNIENKKVYLIIPNWISSLEDLRTYGTLTEVINVHNTPLYYFELDESKDREY